jgi:cell division protease FtsH
VIESAAWRDRLFQMRAEPPVSPYPGVVAKAKDVMERFMIPGMGGMGGGLALNQLLVVMDGIDDPPLMKRFWTNKINTWLDALYVIPAKVRGRRLRLPPPKPRKEEIYFIGACNAPLDALDPALTRPGRMGRHIFFRTPTWTDRRDIFELYMSKVAHTPDLDAPKRRDELARITNGYSPAMIDQVCSLALTYAHSDGRTAFEWKDLVEAMTTVEAGVAIGQEYVEHEERSIAVHEAGHAVCSHLYSENLVSTRLSIRKRGSSGGHHMMMEVEDRIGHWRSEQFGDLIWGLGAMAAEHVFYGQTTTGVGGDIGMVTWRAAQMVGRHGMGPAPIDLSDRIADKTEREEAEEKVLERFEKLGLQLMHRSDMDLAATKDPAKRKLIAQLLGQCFVVAWCTIRANQDQTDQIATRLIAAGELYGDEVTDLLEECRLIKPEIDVLDETTWPVI